MGNDKGFSLAKAGDALPRLPGHDGLNCSGFRGALRDFSVSHHSRVLDQRRGCLYPRIDVLDGNRTECQLARHGSTHESIRPELGVSRPNSFL